MSLKNQKHILKLVGFDMFVIEFGPVAIFLLFNYLYSFTTGALALAIATFLTLLVSKAVNKRVPWFAIFSGVVTMITALVTYIYSAPWVLIVKDSVYYLLFAGILTYSIKTNTLIFEKFFGHVFAITTQGWRILEKRWRGFFLTAALLNEAVRMFLTVEDWIIYKQAVLVVFFFFGMYQFTVSKKYRTEEADKFGLRKRRETTTQPAPTEE